MLKMFKYLLLLLTVILFFAFKTSGQNSDKPVPIIFDTDMGPDYDDVGATAVLYALADSGEAKVLASMVSNRQPEKAAIFDVLNTYFGYPDVPIGIPRRTAVERKNMHGWGQVLVKNYPHTVKSNREVYGAVELYRKILSSQPDHSVTIVTTGHFTNVANLLLSTSDKYSKLNGRELVANKVKKLVSMAGTYPSGKKEYNIYMDIPSADYVFKHWPTKLIFSGHKIGEKIKTGIALINNKQIQHSPVKEAYAISMAPNRNNQGHNSYDQTAVLVAIRGAAPYYKLVSGKNTVNSEGVNRWDYSGSGHYYMIENESVAFMQKLISNLMQYQPNKN